MKNNRGITVTSLIIYLIGMVVTIATISTLTSFFYKNVNTSTLAVDETTQYLNFSKLISDEVNKEDNFVMEAEDNYIVFASGNQYTFVSENKSIYKNNIKVCENIDNCTFAYEYTDSIYDIKIQYTSNTINENLEFILY